MKKDLALFEGKKIRRIWDEKEEKWYFQLSSLREPISFGSWQSFKQQWNQNTLMFI